MVKNITLAMSKTINHKKYKKPIPTAIRNAVWVTYIGPKNSMSMCFCCNSCPISVHCFECGHIISEHDEGETKIDNLRPICGTCNKSMGTKNMVEFMDMYGLKRNKNWFGFKDEKKEKKCIII